MAVDAVAEIHSPRQGCPSAVGVIAKASEEAADASNGYADGQGNRVEVAGRGTKSDVALHDFHGDQTTDESANDGFAADQVGGILYVLQSGARVFQPVEQL